MNINVNFKDSDFVSKVLKGEEQPLPPKGESVTLFWSGGVDSTYMLFWLLAHGYEVHTVYCEIENNSFKVKRENWARGKIRQWASDNHPGLLSSWIHCEKPLSVLSVSNGGWRPCLAQLPIWLLNTQFSQQFTLPETYILSYVNGDDALHWIPAIQKVMEGYAMLSEDKPAELLFPLISLKKSWFYHALEPIHGFLTWCEYAKLSVNCSCPACKRHRHELS